MVNTKANPRNSERMELDKDRTRDRSPPHHNLTLFLNNFASHQTAAFPFPSPPIFSISMFRAASTRALQAFTASLRYHITGFPHDQDLY